MIETINEWGRAFTDNFGLILLQNTLFIIVFLALMRFINRLPANIRYLLGIGILIKCITPLWLPAPFLISAPYSAASPVMFHAEAAAPAVTAIASAPLPDIYGIILLIWIIGVSASLSMPVFHYFHLARHLRNAGIIAECGEKRFGRPILIRLSKCIEMPMTIGLMPRSIYVPDTWKSWPRESRDMIIQHEIAHMRRFDGLMNMVHILVQSIYFFHPLVYFLNRRISEWREMACDDYSVLHKGGNAAITYSRALVEIAEKLKQDSLHFSSASALIRQKNELFNRVHYQLEERMNKISKPFVLMIFSGLVLTSVLFSWKCGSTAPKYQESQGNTRGQLTEHEQARNAEEDSENMFAFIPYDDPPQPVGGYAAIARNLRYPPEVRAAGIEGMVTVRVQIDKSGKAAKAVVIESVAGLDEAALNAVKNTEWTPAMQKGEAVSVWVSVPVVFKLHPEADKKSGQAEMKDEKSDETVFVTALRMSENEQSPPQHAVEKELPDDIYTFIAYDDPPLPIGEYAAIARNLKYPPEARAAGIEGTVTVRAQIDKKGHVANAVVIESVAGLDEAALNAVKNTEWTPAMQKGKAVSVWVSVPVVFRLQK